MFESSSLPPCQKYQVIIATRRVFYKLTQNKNAPAVTLGARVIISWQLQMIISEKISENLFYTSYRTVIKGASLVIGFAHMIIATQEVKQS